MKALYDDRLLDSVDVISSVSGGGYAYWLYRKHLDAASTDARFGEAAFSNRKYDQSICKLASFGEG